MLGTLRYDFDLELWTVTLDAAKRVSGSGDTPEEAVAALKHQANKHDLWPKRGE